MQPALLNIALLDPAVSGLDDAAAAVALSTPVLTPKTERITYTIAGAALGAVKAITLRAGLLAAAAQTGNPTLAATAGYVHDLLSGPGFDASNPEVQGVAGQFVAAGLLTQDDATTLLYNATYKAGGTVTTFDVTAARAAIARTAQLVALGARVTAVYARFLNDEIHAAQADPSAPVPTFADFIAAVGAA